MLVTNLVAGFLFVYKKKRLSRKIEKVRKKKEKNVEKFAEKSPPEFLSKFHAVFIEFQ